MAYIRRIQAANLRHIQNIDINIPPQTSEGFSHIIFTGPNGSGKTTLLNSIAQEYVRNMNGSANPGKNLEFQLQGQIDAQSQSNSKNLEFKLKANIKRLKKEIEENTQSRPLHIEHAAESTSTFHESFREGDSIFFHAPAQRQLGINSVTGPQRFTLNPQQLNFHQGISAAGYILQLLVNKKTERTFAGEDGDTKTVERLDQWLERIRSALGILLEDSNLKMRFERNLWNYTFIRPRDGREFDLSGLSHGHSSAIQLFSEILVRVEASQQQKEDPAFLPRGVAIIDEIETHLHLRPQETILPFLAQAFPTIQFIVATHSPAVVASVPNAVVFDLEKQEAELSKNLQGVRYGDLATGHFGVQTDYDVDTRNKLEALDMLFKNPHRSEAENSQMRLLAGELAAKSHNLALDVLLRLKAAELNKSAR